MAKAKGRVENLRTPTSEEAREIGRKGGLKSAANRKERRRLQDIVRAMLDAQSLDDPDKSVAEMLVASMIESAMAGDVKAFTALRDTAGEKPTEKQQTSHSGEISFSWAKAPIKDDD